MGARFVEHLRAVVWPRERSSMLGRPVYTYAIVGILVTDEPLEGFDQKTSTGISEVVLDGWTSIGCGLEAMPKLENAGPRLGDATNVLLSLKDLQTRPLGEKEPR